MASVSLSPYSPEWPARFEVLRDELLVLFATTTVVVEHIGSTAVPGLTAKPVIDILLGASSLAGVEAKIEQLSERGYSYVSKYEQELPMRRYFVRDSIPRVHLHAVVQGGRLWREQLAFRDALRADTALLSSYESLKLRLALQFADQKSAYAAAKGPFIRAVLAANCRSPDTV